MPKKKPTPILTVPLAAPVAAPDYVEEFHKYVLSKGFNPDAVWLKTYPITDLSMSFDVGVAGMGTRKVKVTAILVKSHGQEAVVTALKKAFDEIIAEDLLKKAGNPQLTIPPEPLEDEDGFFTSTGVKVITAYANAWMQGVRDLEAERMYPEMTGPFYDVRADSDFARRWADPDVIAKSFAQQYTAKINEEFQTNLTAASQKAFVTVKSPLSDEQVQKFKEQWEKGNIALGGFQKAMFVIDDKG